MLAAKAATCEPPLNHWENLMNIKLLWASGLIAAALSATASGTIVYTLDTGNSAVTGAGPYATVSVTDAADGLSAAIEFDSLTNGGFLYLMGDGGTADLNVNGTYTLGTVTETNSVSGFTTSFKDNTPGQVDGFGNFSLSLNNNDGFTDSATQISFMLTNTSGTPWASDAAVLTPNANGAIAAIHVFACKTPCNTGEGAAFTGFAAGSGGSVPPEEIPEPGVLGLLGLGLLGLGVTVIRRRSA
jgi:hypothetical protein